MLRHIKALTLTHPEISCIAFSRSSSPANVVWHRGGWFQMALEVGTWDPQAAHRFQPSWIFNKGHSGYRTKALRACQPYGSVLSGFSGTLPRLRCTDQDSPQTPGVWPFYRKPDLKDANAWHTKREARHFYDCGELAVSSPPGRSDAGPARVPYP